MSEPSTYYQKFSSLEGKQKEGKLFFIRKPEVPKPASKPKKAGRIFCISKPKNVKFGSLRIRLFLIKCMLYLTDTLDCRW